MDFPVLGPLEVRTERGAVNTLRDAVEQDYPARTGRAPAVYVLEATDGAGEVTQAT